jgi:hypothetical protein
VLKVFFAPLLCLACPLPQGADTELCEKDGDRAARQRFVKGEEDHKEAVGVAHPPARVLLVDHLPEADQLDGATVFIFFQNNQM